MFHCHGRSRGRLHRVWAESRPGAPDLVIRGLPRVRARAMRDRVLTALRTSRLPAPDRRVTVHVDPPLSGPSLCELDLPVALSVLAAGTPDDAPPSDLVAAGRLGLDGSLHPGPSAPPILVADAPWIGYLSGGADPAPSVTGSSPVTTLRQAWNLARRRQPSLT